MKRTIIAFLAVLLIFSGCSTTKFRQEPTEQKTNIILGQLNITIKNFDRFHGTNFNGKHTHDVSIFINKPGADEEDRIRINSSGSQGWFFAAGVEPGEYEVVEFSYTVRSGSNWSKLYWPLHENSRQKFTIYADKVNNLGEVQWISDKKEGNVYYFIESFENVKENFTDTFYESEWLEKEWIEIDAKW